MIKTVYTIGYSGFKINDFIEELHKHGINLVVDVRSKPYSQFFSEYNKEKLEAFLKGEKIYYRNFADEFGARQTNNSYFTHGYMDYELFSQSNSFLNGFDKIVKALEMGYKPVLMCAEKDPFNCHRAILVSRAFSLNGYNIEHLLPNNETITQSIIERRLLDWYFPQRNQLSLVDEVKSDDELIIEAYKKRNQDIGYSMGDE
jgi:uncharacterized protein (DUF488 family)